MREVEMREVELLAPAANAEIAIEAIRHGADAVYIGGPHHGARKNAANSIEDIRRVVEFAHPFGARVYATVNTIIYDNELRQTELLIRDLYRVGVDALIVQDMGILRLDIPPIALHASTQCDTRTAAKARFLQDVGFSQIVLARELTLEEIAEIHEAVDVPLECFVHGALCVSYSGCCHASQRAFGRSANRGECAQVCRMPFTFTDSAGKIIERNRHLLSLKDFNVSDRLEELLDAGASSFKIEGRLKEMDYVKNVVAFYRRRIDDIISHNPDKYRRSSAGRSEIDFTPRLDKSFNRGFTHYFLDNRRARNISSPLTPKSMGERIEDITELHNGDGISFFNTRMEYEGMMVNGIKDGRIIGNRSFSLPPGVEIRRTFDSHWQKRLAKPSAERRLDLDVTLTAKSLRGVDERGVSVVVSLEAEVQQASSSRPLRDIFDKFGNTIYRLRRFDVELDFQPFIPASKLADARRRLVEALAHASKASYQYSRREKENPEAKYPENHLDYHGNVANALARSFYQQHGVSHIEPAMEIEKNILAGAGDKTGRKREKVSVMTTRHCILRERGCCLKENPAASKGWKFPLILKSTAQNGNQSTLEYECEFDCKNCEMKLYDS